MPVLWTWLHLAGAPDGSGEKCIAATPVREAAELCLRVRLMSKRFLERRDVGDRYSAAILCRPAQIATEGIKQTVTTGLVNTQLWFNAVMIFQQVAVWFDHGADLQRRLDLWVWEPNYAPPMCVAATRT